MKNRYKPAKPEIEHATEHQPEGIMCDGCIRHFRRLVRVGEVREWDAAGSALLCVSCLNEAFTLGVDQARRTVPQSSEST